MPRLCFGNQSTKALPSLPSSFTAAQARARSGPGSPALRTFSPGWCWKHPPRAPTHPMGAPHSGSGMLAAQSLPSPEHPVPFVLVGLSVGQSVSEELVLLMSVISLSSACTRAALPRVG